MDREISVEALMKQAFSSLTQEKPDPAAAIRSLEEALRVDYAHPGVLYTLKCLAWWNERFLTIDAAEQGTSIEKGKCILSQWNLYQEFLQRIGSGVESKERRPALNVGGDETASGGDTEECRYAIRHFVFTRALHCFQSVIGSGKNQHDPDTLLYVGRCFKGAGNYEEAVTYLEQAAHFKREDGRTLSELADVNALLEETRAAKVLFREAFFADPQGVDLASMESALIVPLVNKVREKGYKDAELLEWIPVYGALYGVFSVKRELKLSELGRLKQKIFSLENEIRGGDENSVLLKPRLINRYFWFIDYLENAGAEQSIIEETLLKIKILDPRIYDRYVN